MKIPVKTILVTTATILALTACGSDDSDVTPTPAVTPTPTVNQVPEVNNTVDKDGSIAKELTRNITVTDDLVNIINVNKKTTDYNRDTPDGSIIYTSTKNGSGAYIFLRMSETDPEGGLKEDLVKGDYVKIVITAKSSREENLIQSLSNGGGLGIPAQYFKGSDGYETFTIVLKVPQTYTPENYLIFWFANINDIITIKSIKVLVKEKA